MNAEERMNKARSILILEHYFFGHLTMKLHVSEDPTCKTAYTDGVSLRYSPKYIDSLEMAQCVGLNAHEVMHCAMGHFWRGEGKEERKWNRACDYEINSILLKEKFELPNGALFDTAYDNLSAEEIYHKLPDSKNKEGEGEGKDPGMCGGVEQNKGDKQKREELKAEWKSSSAQALQMSKNQGLVSNDLTLSIQNVIDPPLPWHVLLRDFVEKTARNDYNWMRPNRRYISNGIILPSLISEELPEVCITIDTSGSTYDIQGEFAKEASGVLYAYNTTIRILYSDAKVHLEEVYSSNELPIQLKPVGGGGTSFIPAFDYIAKNRYTPSCMIYLTDMYGTFPTKEPEYPVMWVTPNDIKGPFGQTVKFNTPKCA